jgi:ferredoxin
MAVCLVRETDPDKCGGCGACAAKCDSDALVMRYRKDQAKIPPDSETLHNMIILEDYKGSQPAQKT